MTSMQVVWAKSRIPALDRLKKKVDEALASTPVKISSIADIQNQRELQLLATIQQRCDTFYWCMMVELVKTLTELMSRSHEQAKTLLIEKIKTHYADKNEQLVHFIMALKEEQSMLQGLDTSLMKLLEAKNMQQTDKDKNAKFFQQSPVYKDTLQKLIYITNTLFMG